MEFYENSYANQKNITVHKENCDGNELYTKINLQAMNHAMKDLKANTYKLWCYFAQNQDNYSFWLSPIAVNNSTGISRSSYHRALIELIEKFYIIEDSKNKNHYIFYETPQDERKTDNKE
jgi:hypothetical protein